MHQVDIDGVPVLWEESPGPFSAVLVFGVGARHESFRTVGVAHLVEHLVMSTLPKSALDSNAVVDIDTTRFLATGQPDAVVAFLSQVCDALRSLPLDRLSTEAGVLTAEEAVPDHPCLCVALGARYGFTGPGLLDTEGPGPHSITHEHIETFVDRHYVRGNAVLVATAPPPASLRLSLPPGDRPPAAALGRSHVALPALLSWDGPFSTFSVVVPNLFPENTVMRVLHDRATDDLRHRRGLAYEIDWTGAWLDETTSLLAIWADAREENVAEVAEGLWTRIREISERPPTSEELDHVRATFEESVANNHHTIDRLQHSAWRLLTGLPLVTVEDTRAELAGLRPEALGTLVADALPSTVAFIPEECQVGLDGLPRRDDDVDRDDPVTGRQYKRSLASIAPLRLQVTAGDQGLTLQVSDAVSTVHWNDVVGLAKRARDRVIMTADGREVPIFARDLRHGDDLLATIDSLVPADLHFTASDELFTG